MADHAIPHPPSATPPPLTITAAMRHMGSSPLRGGKRHIDESAVAYAASLELPVASGRRTFFGAAGHSMNHGTVGGVSAAAANGGRSTPSTPRPAGVSSFASGSGVLDVVFGSTSSGAAMDGDSSPSLARKYNELLYADMQLKNVQARSDAAKASKKKKRGGGDDGDDGGASDAGGSTSSKAGRKRLGMSDINGDYSPRKRIEDYMFLKRGKQWCPPTKSNGEIPEPPPRKRKEGDEGPPTQLTSARQETLNEVLMKPLKRENKKKNKGPPPIPRKNKDGTDMTPDEQARYERTIVPNLMNRLQGDLERRKKERDLAEAKAVKADAALQQHNKVLQGDAALEQNINKLYFEPINKKKTEAAARLRKEEAAKEKNPRLSPRQHAKSGERMYREGVDKQRQAVAKAAERYLLRPASALPTAAYNRSHEIESRYCPELSSGGGGDSPRPTTAAVIPKPPPR